MAEAAEILQNALQDAELDPSARAHTRYLYSVAMLHLAVADAEPSTAERAETAARALIDAGEPPEAIPSSWNNLAAARRLCYERTGISRPRGSAP